MKQSGIWKAVMSIYNNINDFSCTSGKDRKRTYTARELYSKQRPVFVNFSHDLVEHKHYYCSLPG